MTKSCSYCKTIHDAVQDFSTTEYVCPNCQSTFNYMDKTALDDKIKDRVLASVEYVLDKQIKKGINAYGHTLDDCDDDKWDWQNMINEELIDALQYQQKEISILKRKLKRAKGACNCG